MSDERGVMSGSLDGLSVFHGEASTTLARVYARLPTGADPAGYELTGRVVGPRCRRANTLPAVSRLVEVKGSCDRNVLLAEAIVPDPCFWSDEVPMLYDVHVELRRGDQIMDRTERAVGFRGIGRRGRSLFRQGKRWVPRGMSAECVDARSRADLETWRTTPAVMLVELATDALCAHASEIGVWLIADLAGVADSVEQELARLSRHAAAFMAVLPRGVRAAAELRAAAPNVLLAERPACEAIAQVSSQADCVLLAASDVEAFAAAARATTLPIVAHRAVPAAQSLVEARRACDHLQRDLASIGDFAGYVISPNPES